MSDRRGWMRIMGGGCFLNAALSGLLVGLFAASSVFSVNTIVVPFLGSAALSFGFSLFLIRRAGDSKDVMRRTLLAGTGVLLGSIAAVLGITAYLLFAGV